MPDETDEARFFYLLGAHRALARAAEVAQQALDAHLDAMNRKALGLDPAQSGHSDAEGVPAVPGS